MIGVKYPESCNAKGILQALQEIGFIIRVESGYRVHQWIEYQGHIAAFSIRGKAAANARWSKMAGKSLLDATSILQAMQNGTSSNAPTNYLTDLPTDPTKREGPVLPDGSQVAAQKVKKEKHLFPDDSEPMEFADLYKRMYADWTRGTGKDPSPAKLQAWAGVFDAMLRIDGYSGHEIERMMNAIDKEQPGKDGFCWKHVLLSPEKLRKRWAEGKLYKFKKELDNGQVKRR